MTVEEYTHRFHKLTIHSLFTETECQSLTHYKAGLREDICKELILVRLTNIDESYQVTLQLEQQTKWIGTRRTSPGWTGCSSGYTYPTAGKVPSSSGGNILLPIRPQSQKEP
jgi:hypothetical protein